LETNMMWKSAVAMLTLGLLLSAAGAVASEEEVVCTDQPKDKWASVDAVSERLARVIDKEYVLGIDKGCYEAEVIVNDATEIDVYIDPVTMEIVKIRTEGDSDS
jgi:hypothetical protein